MHHPPRRRPGLRSLGVAASAVACALVAVPPAVAGTVQPVGNRYLVVLKGAQTTAAFAPAAAPSALHDAVAAAGGTVKQDLSRRLGVLVVTAPRPDFAARLAATGIAEDVAADFRWKALPDAAAVTPTSVLFTQGAATAAADPLEGQQWDMLQIRAPQAHAHLTGKRAVDVGILDSGIDGRHPDFLGAGGSNVDCLRGHNSVPLQPDGIGVGNPDPCVDNQFHGTHVAGTVGARINGLGVVGVAPDVTLVPVKACDAGGYCYASAVVDAITYAGDQQLDVINMSFFVDDDEFQQGTEFKCSSDPKQRAFVRAVNRALSYARDRGVTPVAALGNSDTDLANPPGGPTCKTVPAMSPGVTGVAALGPNSEKASYSSYGTGWVDVAAPGGNGTTGDCRTTVLSTLPGGGYGCIQGTSMASPHAAGVAALIVSRVGSIGADGDVKSSPRRVASQLQSTAVDIGLPGYDECFGYGRIDALRAVLKDTSPVAVATPFCPEYQQ